MMSDRKWMRFMKDLHGEHAGRKPIPKQTLRSALGNIRRDRGQGENAAHALLRR